MSTDLLTEHTPSSDMLHNLNCYAYLCELRPFLSENVIRSLPRLAALAKVDEPYNASFAYGNLYSFILTYLEDEIDAAYRNSGSNNTRELDSLIFKIYHNDNHILENGPWINKIGAKIRPSQLDIGNEIARTLAKKEKNSVNQLTPTKAESMWNRFSTLFTPNFKPQLDTNLPSIRHFSYNINQKNTEYRFSTQAQRHKGSVRISPLFLRWLEINASKYPEKQPICHVYFNNLGLDRFKILDIPGYNEKQFSLELHKLEDNPKYKIAIITLPASHALMDVDLYKKHDDQLEYSSVFNELLDVAEGKKHKSGVSDFKLSPALRSILFTEDQNQTEILKKLLTNSFAYMGFIETDLLTTAQKQAIWLHFTKYELTDYIIRTLSPENTSIGYNFSCRDAIDRGTVSSTYYNLVKSIKTQNPIKKEEFERALESAAANVKARGMNFHRKIIWNAIDCLVQANYKTFIEDNRLSWLIFWRDMNCPHTRVDGLINLRIQQCKQQLRNLPTDQENLKKSGLKLLEQIHQLYNQKVNGQRLLLEVVARTSQLLRSPPTEESLKEYINLSNELKLNYPILRIVAGLMQTLLGLLLYVPSLGFSKELITKGMSLAKSGFFIAEREQLCEQLHNFAEHQSIVPIA
ncbi:hypothetical protein [Legionella worsleiensis]|uniref:hypothetical protein n=1 Tax=Legionella worsleiensis TaxID=45076 RepID=UPI0007316662|nr:hypothetical protein [Legionella worsleiensis]